MSESKEQFKVTGPKTDIEDASSVNTQPPSNQAPQVQGEVNLQRIDIRRITGPLVVFFGPREIGKTVTLLRLCTYIRSRYQISPDSNFRTDDEYAATTAAFEAMLQSMQFAPGATGDVNFLLLNVTHDGGRLCQFLESPGEHFFDRNRPNAPYPNYMNKIFADNYKKLFVFFFEIDMFRSDEDLRNYSDKIARMVSDKISSKRDRVIILCNKSDLHPHSRGGMPIKSEYRRAIYEHPSFRGLKEALKNSGFRHVPFVAFSSGAFNDDGTGQLAFAPSPEHYPKNLWGQIYESIQGRPWWKFW
jgi:GTPase SAR1 family protein